MLKNVLLAMSRGASVDANDDMLTIYKVIDKLDFDFSDENINPIQREAVGRERVVLPISFNICSVWRSSKIITEGEYAVVINIVSPKEETLGKIETALVVSKPSRNLRTLTTVETIPLHEAGEYKLVADVIHGSKKLATAEYQFEVNFNFA